MFTGMEQRHGASGDRQRPAVPPKPGRKPILANLPPIDEAKQKLPTFSAILDDADKSEDETALTKEEDSRQQKEKKRPAVVEKGEKLESRCEDWCSTHEDCPFGRKCVATPCGGSMCAPADDENQQRSRSYTAEGNAIVQTLGKGSNVD
jgi:hypothetical protein